MDYANPNSFANLIVAQGSRRRVQGKNSLRFLNNVVAEFIPISAKLLCTI